MNSSLPSEGVRWWRTAVASRLAGPSRREGGTWARRGLPACVALVALGGAAAAQCGGGGTRGGDGRIPQLTVGALVAGQDGMITVTDLSPSARAVYIGYRLNAGCTDVSSLYGPGALLVPSLRRVDSATPPFRPTVNIGISRPATTYRTRIPASWAGRTVYVQAFVEDPGAQAGGFALSNGLGVQVSAPGGNMHSSVSQFGITPRSTPSGGRTINGSMVNPDPTTDRHGYDSAMYGQYNAGQYQAALNRALNVSSTNPLVLQPHSSLVSTISVTEAGATPQIQTAAILTVLPFSPPEGSFRPPYCGSDKTVRFNRSLLNTSLLASLPPVPNTPAMSTVEGYFERPWIDHVPGWIGRYHHPAQNMPDYGRDLADHIGIGALMLHLNFSPAQKQQLLVRYVQLGIDLFGIVQAGGIHNWTPNGGHASGRKWPILFAGLMLGDPEMSSVGLENRAEFGEDGQTFIVEETSPGVYNYGFGGYGRSDVGLPDWGIRHSTTPSLDDRTWYGSSYRTCCTANAWWGVVLATRIMRATALWNHDALFRYQDRYRQVSRDLSVPSWQLAWSAFPIAMWDAYRSSY
jgi:hypothetical protein